MKLLKFFLVTGCLFQAFSIKAQCNVVPAATLTVQHDSLHVVNISTGTVVGTSYLWIFHKDPNNSSGVPSGANIFSTTAFVPLGGISYTANGEYLVELLASNSSTCPTYTYTTTVVICAFSPAL